MVLSSSLHRDQSPNRNVRLDVHVSIEIADQAQHYIEICNLPRRDLFFDTPVIVVSMADRPLCTQLRPPGRRVVS